MRHTGRSLLERSGAWETTAWARSMADAVRLSAMLQEAVFAEADRIPTQVESTVGLVRAAARNGDAAPGLRWGVLVRLRRS